MRYSLRQLEVYVSIGRFESVSRAAESLSLTQSATSMALGELERQFDTKLFDRYGKRLQLNERGRQILPYAIELLDRATQLETYLSGDTAVGSLRIGATLTVGNYLATWLAGQYMSRYPGSRVQLDVRNTEQIVDHVAHFKLDFGLIEGSFLHPDVDTVHWVDDELVVFANPNHPLAKRDDLCIDDLIGEPWILREAGSGTRQVFDANFRHRLSDINIALELEHTEAIKRAVASNIGIGCISRLALLDDFKQGNLVPLNVPGLDLTREFSFVMHKAKFRSAGIEAFLEICRNATANVTRADEIVFTYPDGTLISAPNSASD